jgi:hypothetical protein
MVWPLKLGDIERLKRKMGSRKNEKGILRCSQEDLEIIVDRSINKVTQFRV